MSLCSSRAFCLYFCLLGLGLSGYGYYVELKTLEDPTYQPLCDIEENISCSKAFNSSYGRGFGLVEQVLPADHWLNQPNTVFGLGFYGLMTLLSLTMFQFLSRLQTYLAFFSNLLSVYLGYILYFVLEDLCVVCVSIYATNFLLWIASYCKLQASKSNGRQMDIRENSKADRFLRLPTSSNSGNFKKNI